MERLLLNTIPTRALYGFLWIAIVGILLAMLAGGVGAKRFRYGEYAGHLGGLDYDGWGC